ncbi:MAG: tyrosine-type recombinase/integrase [Desulfotomaculales bacterium]
MFLGRGPDGKRQYHREIFHGSRSEARLYAAELEARLKRRTGPCRALNLGGYLDVWLERTRPPAVSERAWQTYEWHVRRLKPHVGHLPLYNLTAGVLQESMSGLFQELPASARKIAGTLRTALRQAVAWGYLPSDPTVGLRTPRARRRARRVLTPGEVDRLLDALKGYRHGLAVRMLLLTGVRLGELLGLKWSDINLGKGTVTIRRSADTRNRKFKESEEAKTPAARRTLTLDVETVRMLEEHRKAAAKAKVSPLRQDDTAVFGPGHRPLGEDSVRRTLVRALKKAGLPRVRVHDLRHTAGSLLLDAGVPLAAVAAFLGHASPATTAAVYAHLVRQGRSVAEVLAHQNAHCGSESQE